VAFGCYPSKFNGVPDAFSVDYFLRWTPIADASERFGADDLEFNWL